MSPVLKSFRDILCKLRPSRGLFHRFLRQWALFLAFLGRKLGFWRLWDDRKRGAFPKVKKTESSLPMTESSSREYAISAASSIPESARYPSLRGDVLGATQPQRAASASRTPHAEPSSIFDATIISNRRYTDSSIRSCSGDRVSIIRSHSGDSLHSHTPANPSTRFPRALHRQFGRGPSLPPSREASRSPSPIPRGHQSPHSEIDSDVANPSANPHPETQIDRADSPVDSPSVTFDAHAQLNTSMTYRHHRKHSATSLVVDIENPSTDSLPRSFFADRPLLTEEPYSISSPGDNPPPVADAPDAREGSPQHSPIASFPSAASDLELPEGRFLQLINSEQVPRYTKEVTVPRERTFYEIPRLTTSFPHVPEPISVEQGSLKEGCAPWVPATHPDGALYFFDQERRLFTDTDMQDSILREEMEDFYHYLQKILRHDVIDIPSTNYDLVLDLMPTEDNQIRWSYYYACHEIRCLFWLDNYDASHMVSELFGVKSPAHVKHRLEALYWTHWSLFPAVFEGRRLDPGVVDQLVGMLSHGCIDVLTSKSSTLPYDIDTMLKMVALVRNAERSETGLVYHIAGVTRLLSFFAHWRFLYFHGQTGARLERHKIFYANSYPERSLLIKLFSPALFLAPAGYLRELEKKWADEVIIEVDWRNFISGLSKDWEQLILSSTVVLSVNVGFLAIPGVVISNLNSNIAGTGQVVIFTSPAQIASCMSIVASTGSIVIGLLLIRHTTSQQNKDPAGASSYLYQNSHPRYGLEPIAIVFSLPWALLMWAMMMFSIAVLLFCFSISNPPTRIFVAVTSVIVAALIWWCIKSSWESSEDWVSSSLRSYFSRALDHIRGVVNGFFALILRRESPPSLPYGHAGNLQVIPDRERVDV